MFRDVGWKSCSWSVTTSENRPETADAKPCSRLVTLVDKSCSRPQTESEKLLSRHETPSEKSVWRTATAGTSTLKPSSVVDGPETCAVKLEPVSMVQPSRESLEQDADDAFRKQLELSVPQYEPGEWKYEFKMSSFIPTIMNLLFAEAERRGKTRHFSDLHWTWIGRFDCRQAVS